MVNRFDFNKSLMANIAKTVGALFVGAFADKYGLKACIIMSFMGTLLGDVVDFTNYAFLEELPLEFLYLEVPCNLLAFVGFYVAVYGLVMRFTSSSKMASRMAFVDGMGSIAFTLGTAPSAPIFRAVGYYGVYSIASTLNAIALLYAIFILKDYPKGYTKSAEEIETAKRSGGGFRNYMNAVLITPMKDLFTTLLTSGSTVVPSRVTLCPSTSTRPDWTSSLTVNLAPNWPMQHDFWRLE